MTNADIAAALARCADLLEVQHADARRVRAYRIAAHSVRTFPSDVAALAMREGRQALDAALYGVGKSIAAAIEQLVRTGRWAMLERLEGAVSCEEIFMSLPGIGHELASRIHERLGVETLEALEQAAHDGRLDQVEGFGPRRARAVRDAMAALFSHPGRSRTATAAQAPDAPSVAALLDVDAHYRNLADQGTLPRIVPRRFNPRGTRSLPILHDEVEGFHVHALFSNSALAHKVKRTQDWVIVHHDRDGIAGQHTVVTEQHGPLEGRRVVRGREVESAEYYARESPAQSAARTESRDRGSSVQSSPL